MKIKGQFYHLEMSAPYPSTYIMVAFPPPTCTPSPLPPAPLAPPTCTPCPSHLHSLEVVSDVSKVGRLGGALLRVQTLDQT